MISLADLKLVSEARLKDARVLRTSRRLDGAIYMCGYAVEIALKACACNALGLSAFPMTWKEFKGHEQLRTHDLEALLLISGREAHIKQTCFPSWNAVAIWKPEARYAKIGTVSPSDADAMISGATQLLASL